MKFEKISFPKNAVTQFSHPRFGQATDIVVPVRVSGEITSAKLGTAISVRGKPAASSK
jgi:hypothetical protein